MAELGQWVGRIVTLVVLFSLLDMIMPDGTLRPMVRTVMGVAVVATVLAPVVQLVGSVPASLHEVPLNSGPAPAGGRFLVDAEGLSSSLWDEALRLVGEPLELRVREAAAREGILLAGVEWVRGADGTLQGVRLHPHPGDRQPARLERARSETARLLGLDEGFVSVASAEAHGGALWEGPAARWGGWEDGASGR